MKRIFIFIMALVMPLMTGSLYGQEYEPLFLETDQFSFSIDTQVYAIIVDVRLKQEYRRGHIPGAVNVNGSQALEAFSDTLDLETPLYLYCVTSTRSKPAAERLSKKGFVYVYVLKPGFRGWKEERLPVGRPSRKK